MHILQEALEIIELIELMNRIVEHLLAEPIYSHRLMAQHMPVQSSREVSSML